MTIVLYSLFYNELVLLRSVDNDCYFEFGFPSDIKPYPGIHFVSSLEEAVINLELVLVGLL